MPSVHPTLKLAGIPGQRQTLRPWPAGYYTDIIAWSNAWPEPQMAGLEAGQIARASRGGRRALQLPVESAV